MYVSENQEVALIQYDIELENGDFFEVSPQSFQGNAALAPLGAESFVLLRPHRKDGTVT